MSKNNYPNDWSRSSLKDLTLRFLNGGTPSTHLKEYWDGSIPWITGADAEQRLTTTSRKSVTELGVKRSATNIVPRGNILLVTRTGVGKVSISGVDVAISQDLTGIIPKVDLVDVPYLYYQLFRIAQGLPRLAQGSIIQGIKREEVEAIEIPLPEPAEQRVIADILSTVDEAIAHSESLVRKYQSIKQGLMSDLLTRGVDENGELRPTREEAPELYRETPLGWLPKDWEAVELKTIASVERGKFTPRPRNNPKYYNGEHPFIQTGEVAAAGGRRINSYTQTLNELGASVSREFPRGAIIVTIAANIGETAILDIPMYVTDSLVGIVVHQPNNVRYVEMFIRLKKDYFNAVAPQSAQKNINLGDLRPMLIAKPKPKEQDRIAQVYESAESVLMNEESNLTKLQLLKQGLMQDLLSGQVRVKVT